MSVTFSGNNPFQIVTPEDLTAEDTVSLFVDVLSDFPKIIDPGHIFLIGPRGTGKSMMFRYMMPDCQSLANSCTVNDLSFFSIYVPLKNTNLHLTEFRRFEDRHASDLMNSHLLTMHFAVTILGYLARNPVKALLQLEDEKLVHLYNQAFVPLLAGHGCKLEAIENNNTEKRDSIDVLQKMHDVCNGIYQDAKRFASLHAFRKEILTYDGPLCDYFDFLMPLLLALRSIIGRGTAPIYLLIDDAHWLSQMQSKVLNTWVASRTSTQVSLKISTEENYGTFYTLTGKTIDTPHDYTEINISTIYTSGRRDKYRDRIVSITKKRLSMAGVETDDPYAFFPPDEEQEAAIRQIGEAYRVRHDAKEGKGHYRGDDALRYARPDFIRELAGPRKSSSKYSYAGFEQLVHLSSGIMRFFIEPAHRMYAEALSKSNDKIGLIPPEIQNDMVRREADRFLFDDLEKLSREEEENAPPKEDIKKLSNLIHALGGLFRKILLSDRSERKVFSLAFSDEPTREVVRIFDLGVQLGYLHRSTLGRKDSRSGGRTRLYVLSRRLAPIWTLDPTGFAGYLFVQSSLIENAIDNPISLLRRIEANELEDDYETVQLTLF